MNMSCEDNKIKITALIDGELDAGEQNRLRRHLEKCPACAAEKLAQSRLRKIVRKNFIPPEPPPDKWNGFNQAILNRVAPTPLARVSQLRVRWATPLALAASLAIVFGVLYFALFRVEPQIPVDGNQSLAVVSTEQASQLPVKVAVSTPHPSVSRFCEVLSTNYLKPGYETRDFPTENGKMVIIMNKAEEKKTLENKN